MRSKFRNCHCPMDSELLAKIWKMYKGDIIASMNCKRFQTSWGKEEIVKENELPKRYLLFQNCIKK